MDDEAHASGRERREVRRHRIQLLVYLLYAGLIIFLFWQDSEQDEKIVDNGENAVYQLCLAQQENRHVLVELVTFSMEGAPTHEEILAVDDPDLRAILLESEERRDEMQALTDDLLAPTECVVPDLESDETGASDISIPTTKTTEAKE